MLWENNGYKKQGTITNFHGNWGISDWRGIMVTLKCLHSSLNTTTGEETKKVEYIQKISKIIFLVNENQENLESGSVCYSLGLPAISLQWD